MKPVAYISKNGVLFKELPPEHMDLEPLYTQKALTDEEIDKAWRSVDHTIEYGKYRIEIAKAIIREAQK
jgi:hypothetical protein